MTRFTPPIRARHVSAVLALLVALTSGAQLSPLRIGDASRVAPFDAARTALDFGIGVLPRGGGFEGLLSHTSEIRSVEIAVLGAPLHTSAVNPASGRTVGAGAGDVLPFHSNLVAASTTRTLLVRAAGASIVISAADDASRQVVIPLPRTDSPATLRGFACSSHFCGAVFQQNVDPPMLAIVNDDPDLVKVITLDNMTYSGAIAADPDALLVVGSNSHGAHLRRIDSAGKTLFDVVANASVAAFDGNVYKLLGVGERAPFEVRTLRTDGTLGPVRELTGVQPVGIESLPTHLACSPSECLALIWDITQVNDVLAPLELSSNHVIELLRFDDGGARLLPLATDGEFNVPSGIARNGSNYYPVWTSAPTTFSWRTVRGALLTAAGDAVSRDVLSVAPLEQYPSAVAQNGAVKLLAWSSFTADDDAPTHLVRLGALNEVLDTRELPRGQRVIDIVALGDEFLVLTQAYGTSGSRKQEALIVRTDGSQQTVDVSSAPFGRAAANRDHWLIAGFDGTSLRTTTVTPAGAVLPGGSTPSADYPAVAGMASDGTRFLVATVNRGFLLDGSGNLLRTITYASGSSASDADFADGVFGVVLNGNSRTTLERYDAGGRSAGSTLIAATQILRLSHIGRTFIVYGNRTAALVTGETILGPFPFDVDLVARTDASESILFNRLPAPAPPFASEYALFARSIAIPGATPRRAVHH